VQRSKLTEAGDPRSEEQMQKGCVLELKNTRTGRTTYGCAGTVQWLIEQQRPTIEQVETLDEAAKRPILDESSAVAWCNKQPHLQYKILRPANGTQD
jgi:hypothetical protein